MLCWKKVLYKTKGVVKRWNCISQKKKELIFTGEIVRRHCKGQKAL
jgi:hypothetical protein